MRLFISGSGAFYLVEEQIKSYPAKMSEPIVTHHTEQLLQDHILSDKHRLTNDEQKQISGPTVFNVQGPAVQRRSLTNTCFMKTC